MKAAYHLRTKELFSLLLIALFAGAGTALALQKTIRSLTSTRTSAKEAFEQGVNQTNPPQKEKKGMGRPVMHFEIGCRDSAKTKDFYAKMFDWQIQQAGPAGVINTGSTEGIQGHITSLGHEPYNYVTVYVQVDDLKTYLDKAATLGGKTLVPPVPIPTGHFAWMADPDGNIIGLLQPKSAPSK